VASMTTARKRIRSGGCRPNAAALTDGFSIVQCLVLPSPVVAVELRHAPSDRPRRWRLRTQLPPKASRRSRQGAQLKANYHDVRALVSSSRPSLLHQILLAAVKMLIRGMRFGLISPSGNSGGVRSAVTTGVCSHSVTVMRCWDDPRCRRASAQLHDHWSRVRVVP